MTSGKERPMTRQRALAEDRLSALPESLLCEEILPKISYRDAVRCSLLSQRWRFLWMKIPQLHFCCQDFGKLKEDDIQAIIENALLDNICDPLHSFQLQIALAYSSRKHLIDLDNWVHNWVRSAARKHVKRITLEFYDRYSQTGKKMDVSLLFKLGDSVFDCDRLEALKLKCCRLPKIPTNFRGFQFLQTCSWYNVWGLNDAKFHRLLELCPNLQNLGVHACFQLRNLKINAPNLKYLDVGLLDPVTSLEIVCPQLTEIKLEQSATTQGLQLLKAKGVSRTESITKITLLNYEGFNQDVPSVSVLDNFPCLEVLTIYGKCFEEMMCVNKLPGVTLENLKKVHVHIAPEMDEKAVTLLGFLLRNCQLNAMKIFLPPRSSRIIQNKLLDLKKEFPASKISIYKIRCTSKFHYFFNYVS